MAAGITDAMIVMTLRKGGLGLTQETVYNCSTEETEPIISCISLL